MEPTGEYQGEESSPDTVKFKTEFQGIPIHVDRPRGFVMKGLDKAQRPWERRYHVNYGFIPKTHGGDGEDLDVFLGPDKSAPDAFWAVQVKADGKFDEFKCFLGFKDRAAATACYTQHIPKRFLKNMTAMKVSMMKSMLGLEPKEKVAAAELRGFAEEFLRST